jgi:hypothetical protein
VFDEETCKIGRFFISTFSIFGNEISSSNHQKLEGASSFKLPNLTLVAK